MSNAFVYEIYSNATKRRVKVVHSAEEAAKICQMSSSGIRGAFSKHYSAAKRYTGKEHIVVQTGFTIWKHKDKGKKYEK